MTPLRKFLVRALAVLIFGMVMAGAVAMSIHQGRSAPAPEQPAVQPMHNNKSILAPLVIIRYI